tara:strand:- start:1790 stop:2464 length:675 start_codon:yes stop_codon:yes gene_type:complete
MPCAPKNPHSVFTEEHYDYFYVDSEYLDHQCSCYHEDDEDYAESYAKDLAKAIADLHDVRDIIEALRGMDPDNETQVSNLIEGIAFYDVSVTDEYGCLLMEDEVPSDLRVLKIEPHAIYEVSSLEDLCKVLRGELDDLVYCDHRALRIHGKDSPLRLLSMMRALTENEPQSLILGNYEDYEEHGLDVGEYESARAHVVTIEYPDEEYTYTFLIDREERKVYLLG